MDDADPYLRDQAAVLSLLRAHHGEVAAALAAAGLGNPRVLPDGDLLVRAGPDTTLLTIGVVYGHLRRITGASVLIVTEGGVTAADVADGVPL